MRRRAPASALARDSLLSAHIVAMNMNRHALALTAALLAVAAAGCSAETKPGPGWEPEYACAVTNDAGVEVEVACPPAAAGDNPIEGLGENVESFLVQVDAKQKALDAADRLCTKAGAEVCDTEALLNKTLPYLGTR